MTTYELKRGDTAPSPRAQLVDGAGVPVNLTGATVKFKARTGPTVAATIDAAAVVEAGTTGWVHYDPVPADTAAAGVWLAEWEVTYSGGKIQTFPGDGYDELAVLADLDSTVSTGGTGYCTRAQARAYGATGSDAAVDLAIAAAESRVDRYTRQRWRETPGMVVHARIGNGCAVLPRQIDPTETVAVRYLGATTDVPTTAYLVTTSRVVGGVDAVWLDLEGGDYLIAGAEPYNGGWANLLPRTGILAVTATFGTATTPGEIATACAMIAGAISAGWGLPVAPGTVDVNDEGETMAIQPTAPPSTDSPPLRTTGVPAADSLLTSFLGAGSRVRIS